MDYAYVIIGVIAVVIIGQTSYLLYLRQAKKLHGEPEKTPEITGEPEDAAKATEATVPPITAESFPGKTKAAAASPLPNGSAGMPPMVAELSSLPEEAKNSLMNAIWYRCENPECNYTQFLDVHHIVSEVEGGTNRLDNLVVLCPRCHLAADNHEIPVAELRYWIRERGKRFKFDLDWPYK